MAGEAAGASNLTVSTNWVYSEDWFHAAWAKRVSGIMPAIIIPPVATLWMPLNTSKLKILKTA